MPKLRTLLMAPLLAFIFLISGCATTQQAEGVDDPLQGYNRMMYSFNNTVDTVIIKPVAKGYDAIVPDPISKGVSNFFSNLNEITVILNDLLQLKFGQAFHDTGRFLLNSTVGIAGVFDIASLSGMEKHDEDFGQTLGFWGIKPGPYVVLPFFGPRNFRDSFGLVGDIFTDPVVYIDDSGTRNAVAATRIIDTRANMLGVKKVLDEAAMDEYSYVRDAYMQHRRNLVYDGDPPDDEDFDVFSDD